MMVVIAIVVAATLKLTVNYNESRVLPSDYNEIDTSLLGLNRDVESIGRLEVLPNVESSWRRANSIASYYGVKFTPYESQTGLEPDKGYTGPLRNWSAQLEGDTHAVLAVAREIQSKVPTFLYEYAISKGAMKLNITIVGT